MITLKEFGYMNSICLLLCILGLESWFWGFIYFLVGLDRLLIWILKLLIY